MKKVVSFSGGRTSGFMLWNILQAYNGKLPEDIWVAFANTGKEAPETLDFINEVSEKWGVHINWLELSIHEERPIWRTRQVNYKIASRNGEPFDMLIKKKPFLPNPVTRFCTSELKINVMKRMMELMGYKEWFNVVGLRYDEPRRVANIRNQTGNKWTSITPMADAKHTINDVIEFWDKQNFDLNLNAYGGKTPAGNCDLCFLKGTRTLIQIIKERPDLADWWIEQEQRIAKLNKGTEYENKKVSTATFNKSRSYTDLVEMARLDAKQISMFDDDGRSCFCHD